MRGLQLIRDQFTYKNTTGRLIYDAALKFDDRQVYTCEDVARPDDVKIAKMTCIPSGEYRLRITYSNRFGRLMPLVYNKEDYVVSGSKKWEGIRMHKGNTEADTDGCLLLGFTRNENGVFTSTECFDKHFFPWLTTELDKYSDKSMPFKIINQQS